MKISLTINNKLTNIETPANRTLSDVLRTHGYWSVKHGCQTGNCGNCVVLVNGRAVNSCIMLAAQAEGKSVETFEHCESVSELQQLKVAIMDFADMECGYCVAGMFLSLKALIDKIPDPTEEEIVDALAGHVCRCVKEALPVDRILEAIRTSRGKF